MEEKSLPSNEMAPVSPIRVETALSRYPIHRLSKREISIDIRTTTEGGALQIRWEVSHNSKYGQPGPLAYKIDTLIVNRKIEEQDKPLPKCIRLGSLKEICRTLGMAESGKTTKDIKTALYQNAFTAIKAKTQYRQANNKPKTVEIGDTRYAVVFTGESLPDGRTADAVYIVLHDFYREILNNVTTRPLDYTYLQALSPIPQRFYELLSYQLFAALKNDRPRAKLLYSELCTYAPMIRYETFDQVKKQMYKIHTIHIKSGYIGKVEFEQTSDGGGKPDWIMFYRAGGRALNEYQTFNRRLNDDSVNQQALPQPAPTPSAPPGKSASPKRSAKIKQIPPPIPLVLELTQRGITVERATELVLQYPDRIDAQLEALDWYQATKPGKIDDPAAYLVKAIERNNAIPKGFVSKAERERREEAKRAEQDRLAATRRAEQAALARDRAEREAIDGYWDELSPEQQAKLDAAALAGADSETLQLARGPMRKFGVQILRQNLIRQRLQAEGKLPLPSE